MIKIDKKFLALAAILVTSCSGESSISLSTSISSQSESTSSSRTIFDSKDIVYEDIFTEKIYELNPGESDPHISLDNDVFYEGDPIPITCYRTGSKDWVGLYPEGGYPGDMTSLTYKYANRKDVVELTATLFQTETKYGIYLCDNDNYYVLDYKPITILHKDTTDYKPNSASFGYKDNEVSVTINPSNSKELSYEIFWAKDGVRLEGYSRIKYFTKASSTEFSYSLGSDLVMPNEANEIEVSVFNGKSTSIFIDVNDGPKLKESKYLYSFNVLTDTHIRSYLDAPNHVEHLQNALNDIYYYNRNSAALFCCGDQTDQGSKLNWSAFNDMLTIYNKKCGAPTYCVLGNHEYMYGTTYDAQIKIFKKYAKVDDIFYTTEMEGSTCIIMGSEERSTMGSVTEERVNWLKEQLDNAPKDKPIFVFLHQPLLNTVAGSYTGQGWALTSPANDIQNLLKDYKNTFFFSGHTHWEMESRHPIQINKGGTTYINCASCGYLWNDNNVGEPGSEGLYVDVYEDYLVFKGRENVKREWLSYATWCVPLY